jgi:hypothetical protein
VVTVITGQPAGTTNNGDGAIRCVYGGGRCERVHTDQRPHLNGWGPLKKERWRGLVRVKWGIDQPHSDSQSPGPARRRGV